MKQTVYLVVLGVIGFAVSFAMANSAFDGQPDNQIGAYGYYYMMTGGKFPTGSVPNGDNGSGGTFRFILDDPYWGYSLGTWQKDDWFPENASFAVTLRNGGAIQYDNNGIEDGTYGDYYDATGLANSGDKPGLYRGYSMSNNYDWIYAGYFKLEQETTVDEMIGYFDAVSGLDPDNPNLVYDMNIWRGAQDDPVNNPNSWMPDVDSFTGSVFSAKSTPGTFIWSDTGVDRVFGDDDGNVTDDIWRLTYSLDSPITLDAGVYFFSHDAEIVPEPLTMLGVFGGVAGIGAYIRKRRMAAA